MAKNKTVETQSSVVDFLKDVEDDEKREDCIALVALLKKHTSLTPKMWGPSIVGFGRYHYKYESGREGDAPLIGLSPRANAITLYLSDAKTQQTLLEALGKHKLSGGCLHLKKLEDVDTKILLKLVDHSIKHLKLTYPE